jgi:hypothetical protein
MRESEVQIGNPGLRPSKPRRQHPRTRVVFEIALSLCAGDVTRSGSLSRRGPAVACYFVRRLPEGVMR